jgi:hypothetical protein
MDKKPEIPLTKFCHCDGIADKYFVRNFINQVGYKVYRVFYRCRNCCSRIHTDICPTIDNSESVNVFDLLKKHNQ